MNGEQSTRFSGPGFSERESVKVSIDLHMGTVEWSVEGKVRQKAQCDRLKDPSIAYVPVIYMIEQNASCIL